MMRAAGFDGPPWPNVAQRSLLRAALATDGSAAGHFAHWLTLVDFEGQIDESSYRLLPLVWSNLRAIGDDNPFMPRLKGVFRSNWVQAARRSAIAPEVLQALEAAGIPTLVLKGLPLALAYYKDSAQRPMSDLDIAVPRDQALAGSAVLEALGYRPDVEEWDGTVRHAVSHVHPQHGEVDLHSHVLFECPSRAANDHFWTSALPMTVGGTPTLRPCATDLLIHVIVHGVRWNLVPPMRWVVDSAMILRSGEDIDWPRLVDFAVRYRLARRVGLALEYLETHFDMPVPGFVSNDLGKRFDMIEGGELAAMRNEARRPAWRHVRRGMQVLRLFNLNGVGTLPVALIREARRRYFGK